MAGKKVEPIGCNMGLFLKMMIFLWYSNNANRSPVGGGAVCKRAIVPRGGGVLVIHCSSEVHHKVSLEDEAAVGEGHLTRSLVQGIN